MKHLINFILTLICGGAIATLFIVCFLFTEEEIIFNTRNFAEQLLK